MKDKQLIFLISQPRSGSTLTQKILASHKDIYTRSEPWLMLHPLYSLKNEGLYTEYDAFLEKTAFNSFIEGLPDKKETYLQYLREMYLGLYSEYLTDEKQYFLDKTPRYYHVVNELMEAFPNAVYILLIRNPLAVLGSIIDTWTKENWFNLSGYKHDLFKAIDVNIDLIKNKQSKVSIIYYEELIKKNNNDAFNYIFPKLSLAANSLELDFTKDKFLYGDEKIYNKSTIEKNNDKRWQKELHNPQYWRVMYDYLLWIGKERFEKLGYDYDENLQILEASINLPIEHIKDKTFSLFSFLDDTRDLLIEKHQINLKLEQLQTVLNNKNIELEQLQTISNQKQLNLTDLLNSIENLAKKSIKTSLLAKYKAYRNLIKLYTKLSNNE